MLVSRVLVLDWVAGVATLMLMQTVKVRTSRLNKPRIDYYKYANDDRGDMEYDIVTEGRYHNQVKALREEMHSLEQRHQGKFGNKLGMLVDAPPLLKLSPSIDLIRGFPGDPPHSEYQGMTKLLHGFLLEGILTVAGVKQYVKYMRSSFPFPPGFSRL